MLRNRRERGEGQLGCLVGLIFLALGVFIAFKMVPVKVRAAEVRQVVVDEAKSAGTHNDKVIMGNILSKAHEDNIPLTEDNVVQIMSDEWNAITPRYIRSQYRKCLLMRSQNEYEDCPAPASHKH